MGESKQKCGKLDGMHAGCLRSVQLLLRLPVGRGGVLNRPVSDSFFNVVS